MSAKPDCTPKVCSSKKEAKNWTEHGEESNSSKVSPLSLWRWDGGKGYLMKCRIAYNFFVVCLWDSFYLHKLF